MFGWVARFFMHVNDWDGLCSPDPFPAPPRAEAPCGWLWLAVRGLDRCIVNSQMSKSVNSTIKKGLASYYELEIILNISPDLQTEYKNVESTIHGISGVAITTYCSYRR